MFYRCLRKVDTGQWINVLFTVEGDAFSVKAVNHRAAIAEALGVPRTSLEVVDGDSDPRTGVLIELPEPSASPGNARLAKIAEISAIPWSDWTTAQLRELVQLTAQEALD